jgi:hypothetical protein
MQAISRAVAAKSTQALHTGILIAMKILLSDGSGLTYTGFYKGVSMSVTGVTRKSINKWQYPFVIDLVVIS